MFDTEPNIWGKELEKDGAAWMAAKWIFPMLSLGRWISKTSGGLGRRELSHSRVVKTEGCLSLGDRDLAGNLRNVLVELSPDVVVITEDERLLQLKTDCDNVFGVLLRERVGLIDFELMLEEKFLVIWRSSVLRPSAI